MRPSLIPETMSVIIPETYIIPELDQQHYTTLELVQEISLGILHTQETLR